MNCLKCNKTTTNPKFCSLSCSSSYNNNIKPKKQKNKIVKTCTECGKIYSSRAKKFCSRNCHSKNKWSVVSNRIKDSNIVHNKGNFHSSKSAKRFLQENCGHNCSICGIPPFWNNESLIMILDHINGIPDDWNIANLRLVCPNCDTQLPTYKSKNKNGGRPHRRV